MSTAALRPGEYLLYFWLGNSESQAFDVADNLVAPLLVTLGDWAPAGFNTLDPVGYFSVDSRLEVLAWDAR